METAAVRGRLKSLPAPMIMRPRSWAGPTMKTTPIITSSTTEKMRMTVFMVGPRYMPVSSEMLAPSLRMESIPLR